MSSSSPSPSSPAAAAAGAHSDAARTTEQILSQFLSKAAQSILLSRDPRNAASVTQPHAAAPAPTTRRDRWFHLSLGPSPSPSPPDPLVIDVLLSPRDDPSVPEPVVERWVAHCNPAISPSPLSPDAFFVNKTYKKCIVLLRALYASLRILPVHRLFRKFSSSAHSFNYDLSCRMVPFAPPFSREEESRMRTLRFAPVDTMLGTFDVTVQFLPSLDDFQIEITSLAPPMLINDYVGSPAADPIRAFPASLTGSTSSRAVSFPPSAMAAPAAMQRPHSWTSPISVPRVVHQRVSVSPTPSPPTFSGGGYSQFRSRGEGTAPVTIPQPIGGRSGGVYRTPNFSDPSRNSLLPPPSPKSGKGEHSAHGSPSERDGRSFRRAETARPADIITNMYAAQKGKDAREESGRFSGALSSGGSPRVGFSRSSSRLSIPDDDDPDFYPFAVDDVDTLDPHRLSDAKDAVDFAEMSLASNRSQVAAVGELVQMLRSAAPLRDHSCSSQTSKPGFDVGGGSSSIMSRTTFDALDELQSYRDLKEMLQLQNRAKLQEPGKRRED